MYSAKDSELLGGTLCAGKLCAVAISLARLCSGDSYALPLRYAGGRVPQASGLIEINNKIVFFADIVIKFIFHKGDCRETGRHEL